MRIIKPFIHQSVFIQAPYRIHNTRFFFLIGGYASGKTTGLNYSLIEAIKYFSSKKDGEGKNPKIGVCGITLTFLKKTFTGALVSLLQASKSQFNYDKAHNILYIGGVELHMTPIEDEDAIFGFDWCCAFIDELDELPTHKSPLVVKALNDRCRQTIEGCREPFLCFATTSQGLKGTYKVIQNFKKIGMNYFIVRGETKANTSLPASYIDAMYKIYNEKERACFLEGKFVDVNAGNVYPDYLENDHSYRDIYQELAPHETVYIGQDFNAGFNKAVACVVREGVIYAIKNYSFPDVRRAPEVYRYDFPYNKIKWIPDATYNQNLSAFRAELRAFNIEVVYKRSNPLVKDRTFLINKLFYADRTRVCDFCQDLNLALLERQNDPKTGLPMKGKGEDAPDHICDAFEYVVYHLTQWSKELQDIYTVTIGRRFLKRAEMFEEGEDAQLHTVLAEDIT